MDKNNQLSDKILKHIQSHKVKMRPKAYFTAGAILIGSGLAASVLVAVFFVGVIVFRLRVNAPFGYLQGAKNLTPVLENIPWIPILIAIGGIAGGIMLMRKFDFSYKHAFLGIAGGFLISVGIFGIIVDATGVAEQAEQLRPLQPLLHVKYSNDSWVAGTITGVGSEGCQIETPNGNGFYIHITDKTIIIPPTVLIRGEWVRILGERNENSFIADEIIHRNSPRRTPQMKQNSFPPLAK